MGQPPGLLQNLLINSKVLQEARTSAPEFKTLYKGRREQITKDRAQILRPKEQALQAAREKVIKEKERLSHEIMQYGLWQTAEEISSGLADGNQGE